MTRDLSTPQPTPGLTAEQKQALADRKMGRAAVKLMLSIRQARGDEAAMAKLRQELDLEIVHDLCANTLAIISTFNRFAPQRREA